MKVFFSEEKLPDLDILIESKDIIYIQPTRGYPSFSKNILIWGSH